MNALAVVSPSVSIVNQRPVTTSKAVAEFFHKQHKDVLRKVESLIADLDREWGQRNFTHTPYIDPQNGQQYPAYEITRDGFTLLAMGFTGKRALEWKIKYIDAFNAMEKELHQTDLPRQYPGDKLTPAQLRTLQEAVAQRTEGMTDKARAAAFPKLWGALKSHFHVPSYRELPPEDYDAALSLIGRLPLDGEYLSAQTALDPQIARELDNYLKDYGLGVGLALTQLRNLSTTLAALQVNLSGIDAMTQHVREDLKKAA